MTVGTTTDKVVREKDGDGSAVDAKLFKTIGLYQLLRPYETGSAGDRCKTALLFVIRISFGFLLTQVVRILLATGDLERFVFTILINTTLLNMQYKYYVMVTNADSLRDIMDVTSYGFTSCGRRDRTPLHRCRDAFRPWLRVYTIISVLSTLVWVISPLLVADYAPFDKLDGTVGCYRQTVYNMWFPISERAHNWTPVWSALYAVEIVITVITLPGWVLFDCYLVTVCMLLAAQFRTMTATCETLGRRSRNSPPGTDGKWTGGKPVE